MKSQLMTQAELADLQASGKTLEQDERGIKVTLLPDGNILKVFRLRRWFSSGLVYSTARRFCRNAARLKKLGIPTVTIISLHHVENCHFKTVKYVPLEGETVRNLLKINALNQEIVIKLGSLIAQLHDLGIYFKSLHFGNVVLTPNQELGLIDISDLRIYPWALTGNTRLRSFKRLYRYSDDAQLFGANNWKLLASQYTDKTLISASFKMKLNKTLQLN